MPKQSYVMENPEENTRLDLKTDIEIVREQALWCGINPGMRILDVGCGTGKISYLLHQMAQPHGEVVAVDFAEERIHYAQEKYKDIPGLSFQVHDIKRLPTDLKPFDLIWARFFLEYFRQEAFEIVSLLAKYLKPNGRLCLIDLDQLSLNHYPIPKQVEEYLMKLACSLRKDFNFDPYIGRKLYTFLYDLHFRDIQVDLRPHNFSYGDIKQTELFDWQQKINILSQRAPDVFITYPGGRRAFVKDFLAFIESPRRFTYTPLILAKGTKPIAQKQVHKY